MQAAADAAKDQANREERVNEGEQEKGAPQVQVVDGKIIINRDTLVVEAGPPRAGSLHFLPALSLFCCHGIKPVLYCSYDDYSNMRGHGSAKYAFFFEDYRMPHSRVQAQRSGDAGDIAEFKRVLEDQPLLNSRSYSSWVPAQRWKEDETELFYQALGAFGTDLTLITRLFPSRERGQVKRKYLMECRKNPARVDAAIKGLNRDPAKLRQLIERLKQAETETLGTLTQPSAPSVPLLTSGSASTPRPSAANPRGGRDVSDSVATQEGPAAAAQPAHPYDNGMPLDDDEAYVY
jgi:hypothetical protein